MKKKVPKSNFFTRRIILGLLLFFSYGVLQAQQVQIKGMVSSTDAETLPGVTIKVDGTTSGTITDLNGNYIIKVPSKESSLVFSYVGFQQVKVKVGDKTTINIILKADLQNLDEVIVVGYGTQKRASITGSLTSISAAKIMDLPSANLSSALAGRLSGVIISQGTGKPGTAASFSIRAQGTINNTEPLYVINGVVRDKFAFDGLDASEVENISVLKDGASAAIYGSRAANGVVLVTTRKGKMGKPVIT